MAKTKQPLEKIPSELLISKDEAELKLKERILKGDELLALPTTNSLQLDEVRKEYRKWDDYNFEYLRRIFSINEEAEKYNKPVRYVFGMNPNLSEKVHDFRSDIKEKIHRLDSLVERIDLISLNLFQNMIQSEDKRLSPNKKVFVVHGKDELAKTSLETLLHEMGLETIVLHRQADEGQTIIEKFEKHSDVGYAFILLTPDEIAYFAHEDSLPDDERKKEKRARANVIFEFGYFVGKLGRNKVCCVYTGDVSLPSDVSGMIYKKYISSVEEVAYSITKDLKVVGIIH